jgi:DNA-binding transcriptional ArsR family regulator
MVTAKNMNKTDLHIDVIQLRKAAMILRAVNHKLRQQMLKLLHENKRMNVTSIYVKLRIEQSVASQHLAILRTAGFVNTERNQKMIFYSINYERLNEVQKLCLQLIEK